MKNKKDRSGTISGTITNYTYYCQGWVKQQVTGTITLSYLYDNSGNPTKVTTSNTSPSSKEEIVRQYDALNRVTRKELKKDSDTTPYYTVDSPMTSLLQTIYWWRNL